MLTKRTVYLSFGLFFCYMVVVIASGVGWNPFGIKWKFDNPGAFGDAFGPINSLMASVAAISAFAAYRSQREELNRVRAQANIDLAPVERRDFEQTFFNLHKIFRDIVSELDIVRPYIGMTDAEKIAKGKDYFRVLLDGHIKEGGAGFESNYKRAYRQHQDDLGHYFRTFYHILRFIKSSSISNKMLYSRILRASLSEPEIEIIALNCIHGGGLEKLKPLVEEYSMLHNISSSAAKGWHLTRHFNSSAFGDRSILSDGSLSQ